MTNLIKNQQNCYNFIMETIYQRSMEVVKNVAVEMWTPDIKLEGKNLYTRDVM